MNTIGRILVRFSDEAALTPLCEVRHNASIASLRTGEPCLALIKFNFIELAGTHQVSSESADIKEANALRGWCAAVFGALLI
jgi:hypothetical protein